MKKYAHKIGAIFFALWGLLHVFGAAVLIQQARQGASLALSTIGSATAAADIPPIGSGLTASVLAYYAWNLLWVGLLVIVIAVKFNWQNNPLGFWLNSVIVSAVDLGLIVLLIAPGYMAVSDGMLGILLWLPALLFSAIGLFANHEQAHEEYSLV